MFVGDELYNFDDLNSLLTFIRILKSDKEIIVGFQYRTQLASMSRDDAIKYIEQTQEIKNEVLY